MGGGTRTSEGSSVGHSDGFIWGIRLHKISPQGRRLQDWRVDLYTPRAHYRGPAMSPVEHILRDEGLEADGEDAITEIEGMTFVFLADCELRGDQEAANSFIIH